MDTRYKPISHRIEWLMEHARQYSASLSSSEATIARQRYMAEHPSAIAALNAWMGASTFPSTRTGRPASSSRSAISEECSTWAGRGQRVLLLITYHYSKGDEHRGCAGFNYDTQAVLFEKRESSS